MKTFVTITVEFDIPEPPKNEDGWDFIDSDQKVLTKLAELGLPSYKIGDLSYFPGQDDVTLEDVTVNVTI